MWFVYILECEDKTLYTGITNDLEKRLKLHISGKGGAYTRSHGAKRIIYSEKARTRSEALKREMFIKALTRAEKLALIS